MKLNKDIFFLHYNELFKKMLQGCMNALESDNLQGPKYLFYFDNYKCPKNTFLGKTGWYFPKPFLNSKIGCISTSFIKKKYSNS